MNDYETRVFKFLTDLPAGAVKDLSDVKEKEQFIQASKRFIDQGGKAEFNQNYTRIRKTNY